MPMPSNNTKFIPCKTTNGFYYILPNDSISNDNQITKYISLSVYEYRFKLVEEYEAIIDPNIPTVFFTTKDNCQKAIDWINSIIVMNKLSQDANDELSDLKDIYMDNFYKNVKNLPSSYYLPSYSSFPIIPYPDNSKMPKNL